MIKTIDKEAVEEKIKIENGLPVQVLSHITHSEKNEFPIFYVNAKSKCTISAD